jgi:hypothetical protein
MNVGPGNPSGGGGQRRRRRGRRPSNRAGNPGGRDRQQVSGIYSAPMDHSYRGALGGDKGSRGRGGRPGFAPSYAPMEPEPLPPNDDANSRIFAFVDDLFFQAKIQETARKLGIKVEFVKGDKEAVARLIDVPEGAKPTLVVFDLNNLNAKPLSLIPKFKTKFKKATSIIGFLNHLQGDLKAKAVEAGCDTVMPRSAFSQSLPNLLRRYGLEEEDEYFPQPA